MMDLQPPDFEIFFEEVYGHPPFKWQKMLAKEVFAKGWPKMLDMPTASGKTSVIAIAVFHLALESLRTDRRAPMRIAFVVDRRLVVDDAFDHHALRLYNAIAKPETPIVKKAAAALKKMSPETPLLAVKLRGGMPQDRDWARTPSQPLVIVSTVDQVGSRLLFRGYGVSNSMKPVHAGLLGADTLFILDEAHTSRPFVKTLEYIRRMHEVHEGALPFETMFMSATLPDEGEVFPPKKTRNKILSDKEMCKRMEAHKHAKLIKVRSGTSKDKMIRMSLEIARGGGCWKGRKLHQAVRSVGVVVNRVNLAREVFEGIKKQIEESGMDATVHLLTGRSRPLDRDLFIKGEIAKMRPGSKQDHDGTVFFVATQCIEVGADIDFDALVTQIAPLDSLRQRFGRLDRIGCAGTSYACIVADESEISGRQDDFLYKDRLASTWKYLKDVENKDGEVDFGIAHLKIDTSTIRNTAAPTARSVQLFPQYIKSWAQTSPPPRPCPEPGIFLHGAGAKSADVQVIWRTDLTSDMLDNNRLIEAKSGLEICSPSTLESVSIPIWIIKKWLAGEKDETLADTEGSNMEGTVKTQDKTTDRVLLWRGIKSNMTRIIDVNSIHPGDTIVVPASRGGCDEYGWNPYSGEPVKDMGTASNIIHRNRLSMRLDKNILDRHFEDEYVSRILNAANSHSNVNNAYEFIDALISADALPGPWKDALGDIGKNKRPIIYKNGGLYKETLEPDEREKIIGFSVPLDSKQINALVATITNVKSYKQIKDLQVNVGFEPSTEDTTEIYTNDDDDPASSLRDSRRNAGATNTEVELIPHCNGVSKHVDEICGKIGVSKQRRGDMVLAGLLHDVGKAEKREQAFLRRVDPDDVEDSRILAKSAYETQSYNDYRRYTELARLPVGYRHECWSVVMAKSHPNLKKAHDSELVKYLIGTHHGHGRPLFPPTDDIHASGQIEFEMDSVKMSGAVRHGLERLDYGWVDMCDRLYARYGPWELAHMEAIVRLADHLQSHEEKHHAE